MAKNKDLKTIEDFLESFNEYEIDWIEYTINYFSHEFPMDDFYPYIIVNDNIKIEKEYVLVEKKDRIKLNQEIFVYTNKEGYINGYAFNKD